MIFSSPREPTAAVVSRLIGARSQCVLDVGARWGAEGAWYALDPLAELVGFEADEEECRRLNAAARPGQRFFPVALGEESGAATLHLTREPGCSSLLPPDPAAIARFPLLEVMTPTGTREVRVESLDDWARRADIPRVAFAKLDTQGSELSILRGGASLLGRCLGFEVEVEFFPLYRGQPLFADVDTFARAQGFSLWRLSHLVHYAERRHERLTRQDVAVYDGASTTFAAGAGRLSWGHALYLRDHHGLDPTTPEGREDLMVLAAIFDAAEERDGLLATLDRLLAGPLDHAAKKALAAHRRTLLRA